MKLALVLSALILSACTFYRIAPDTDKLFWVNGKGYQTVENANVSLAVAVDEKILDTNIFYVEITNKSKQPMTVGPDQFVLKNKAAVYQAQDPETQIAFLTQQMKMNNLNAEPGFGDALMSIPSPNETAQERHEREARVAQASQDRADAANSADRDRTRIDNWASNALRKNTLAQGQKIAGFLKFRFAHEGGPLVLEMLTDSKDILTLGFHEVEQK